MDNKLTEDIQTWVNAPYRDEAYIIEGASLLLRLNRNKYMYTRATLKPRSMEAKIEYELKKHLRYRLDGYTLQEVAVLDQKIMPQVAEVVADGAQETVKKTGKRDDHDNLPKEIQEIWDANHKRWVKIKNLYNTLLGMEKAMPCDRYEFLKQMSDLFNEYKNQMEVYDSYKPGDAVATIKSTSESAIKYLRKNLKVVPTLKGMERDKLIEKMQKRYNYAVSDGQSISAELTERLREVGVSVIEH